MIASTPPRGRLRLTGWIVIAMVASGCGLRTDVSPAEGFGGLAVGGAAGQASPSTAAGSEVGGVGGAVGDAGGGQTTSAGGGGSSPFPDTSVGSGGAVGDAGSGPNTASGGSPPQSSDSEPGTSTSEPPPAATGDQEGDSGSQGDSGGQAAPADVDLRNQADSSNNGGATDVGVTSDRILIGGLISSSGAVGSTIGPYKLGYDAYVNYYNQTGGVNGRTLEVAWFDTAGNSGENASGARELVENQQVFVLTEADPLATGASASYLNDRGVPVVAGGSAHPAWFQTPVMFPMGNQYNGTATMGAYAHQTDKATKFAVMWENIQVSSEGCAATVQALEERGAEIVYTANIPVGSPDLSSWVSEAKSRGADGILQCFELAMGVSLMSALERQGWKPYVGAVSGSADQDLLQAASPETLEGMEVNFPVPAWTYTDLEAIKLYHQAMRATHGGNPHHSVWSVRGFVSAMLLTTALEQIGPEVTRQKILDWLNQQDYESLSAMNQYLGELLPPDTTYVPDANGFHVEARCSMEARIEGGTFVRAMDGWYCLE